MAIKLDRLKQGMLYQYLGLIVFRDRVVSDKKMRGDAANQNIQGIRTLYPKVGYPPPLDFFSNFQRSTF
jgi:hypothetical protein